jgi:hypothetical protein
MPCSLASDSRFPKGAGQKQKMETTMPAVAVVVVVAIQAKLHKF